jgi:peptidoglycan/xylan/chitin deacetylase (PgdA/CDA1 family)
MNLFSALSAALLSPLFLGTAGTMLFGRTIRTLPGLLFHSVVPDNRFVLSSISVSRFMSIVRAIKACNYKAITAGDAPAGPGNLPGEQNILLTFDDGCRSFYQHALPLLEELKLKATVFPVAGYIGRSSSWDVLPSFSHLTKSDIMQISALGHEIGSHGLTHADLTCLKLSDVKNELGDSKKILEDITGKEVVSLSFPFGSWNTRIWELAQELGYNRGTIYRKHHCRLSGLFPVYGVYAFDTAQAVLDRITPGTHSWSPSAACAGIMSHFAKGTPLWKFGKRYALHGHR